MYLKTWDEFQKAAEELYTESPETTRYVSGFRHVDGELVLKVTNDQSIVKYKTKEAADLKKFANLNSRLMRRMQNVAIVEHETSDTQPMEIISGNASREPVSTTGPQIPEVQSTAASTPSPKPSPTPPTQGKKKNIKKKRR